VIVESKPQSGVTLTLHMSDEEAADFKGLLFRSNWVQFPFAEQIIDELVDYSETDTTISDGEVAKA
jgi:hypothetical protein